MGSQLFTTVGSDSWNWPAGVSQCVCEALGGGGGGGEAQGNPSTGGGGKGGSYAKKVITKGAESALDIVVGTGGTGSGGAGFPSYIQQGGTTVFLAAGGGGGGVGASNSSNGVPGTAIFTNSATTGTAVAIGDTIFVGGNGGTGDFTSGSGASGGGGGAAGASSVGGAASVGTAGTPGTGAWVDTNTYQAAGAAGVGNSTAGAAGNNYGGGGSGGKANNNPNRAGGAGAQGILLLTWTDPATNYDLIAETGTFSYTGADASLFKGHYLNAEAGTFSYAGGNATLTYTPAGPPPTISQNAFRWYDDGTETGATALAAQDTNYLANVTGGNVNLQLRVRLQSILGEFLAAETGTFSYTGGAANLIKSSRILQAETGTFSYTGQDATLTVGGGGPGFVTHTGTFAANTSTGNQVIDTGTGVEGKAVLFFGHKVTAAGNKTNLEMWLGAATSSTQEWGMWGEVEDAQATSDASRRFDDGNCILIYDTIAGVPTANGIADFVSFGTGVDAGKFTINWSDAPASAFLIHYQFLGGSDITNAKAGVFNFPTAAGTQDVTSVGFTPDFTLLGSVVGSNDVAAAPGSVGHASMWLGMATDSVDGVVTWKSENNRATWDSYRYQNTNRVMSFPDNAVDTDVATYTSGIANGFRLNWSAVVHSSGTSELFYLCLQGGQYQVGSFTTQTSTGNFNVATNFQGAGAMFMSSLSSDGSHINGASKISFGAATSSTARGAIGGADSASGEVADTRSSTALIYTNISAGTPTVDGEIDFVSFNPTNMTLNQTDADPTGQTVIFVIFGE